MDSLYADQTVPEVRPQTPLQRGWREGGSDIDDIYFKSTDPNRFDAVRPNRQWKEVTLRDPKQSEINGMLDNGYVIQKKLDNGDVIMRSVEKPPKVKGDLAKPDRFKILNNPTADEIKLHEAQGYSVTERNASGDVTLKYTGVEPAKINTGANQGAAGAAKAESKYSTKKFLKNNPALKSITDRLIKMRSANDLIGKGVRDKFKDVASIPKEKVVEFQKGITEGKHPGVREFFDNLHETVTSRGLDLGKKANYLPQIWDNTEDEIVRALGDKALSERASFQYHSFIQDYEAGIKAGLKPKLSPIELMTNYAQRVNKLIADNEALSALKKNGYVVQENKKTADMLEMDPNLGTFKGYYAHPEVKNAIEGYLQSPETQSRGFGSRLAKGVGKATNLALSSGVVPGRPLFTAHGLNLAAPFSGRSYMEGGIKRNIQALKFGLSPKKATALLEAENEQMVKATQEHGFKANVEDPAAMGGKFFEGENLGKFKKGFNFLSEAQNKYFEGPLFDKMIPALKWTAWKENYAKFIKQGMSEAEAGKNATQITDSFYSGKNLDLIYQSKNSRTAARILLMAPDWLRSTVDLGVKIPKSLMPGLKDFNSPASKAYRAAGARLMGTYVAANLAQYAATGKFMFENAPGDQFNLDFGETLDGQDRKVKLFGNAADFFKIPVQVAQSVASGEGGVNVIAQAVENRVSPLLRLITDFGIVGENFKGEPNIRKTRDNFGNPIPLGQRLKNTASQAINFGPPQFAQPINKATGRAGWEEFMSRIAELPLAYKDKKNPFEYKPPSRTSYEYNLTGRR